MPFQWTYKVATANVETDMLPKPPRFISNWPSRLGRATCSFQELYHCHVAFISQTLPQHQRSSKLVLVCNFRFFRFAPTQGPNHSYSKKKTVVYNTTSNGPIHLPHGLVVFNFTHESLGGKIHLENLECVKASGSIVEPEFDRSARTGGKGGRPAFDNATL